MIPPSSLSIKKFKIFKTLLFKIVMLNFSLVIINKQIISPLNYPSIPKMFSPSSLAALCPSSKKIKILKTTQTSSKKIKIFKTIFKKKFVSLICCTLITISKKLSHLNYKPKFVLPYSR